MSEKESVEVHLLSGIRELAHDPEECVNVEDAFDVVATADNTLTVDLTDPERDIAISHRDKECRINFRHLMEMQITEKAAQILGRKLLEGAKV